MNYVKGDLFEHIKNKENVLIPHVVNDKGAWGAGFVLPLAKHFPEAKQQYQRWFDSGKSKLGETQMVFSHTDNDVTIANMCAQTLGGKRPLRYDQLVKCMRYVTNFAIYHDLDIHCPMFGSGLAGGNWDFIECLIEDIWGDLSVTVYVL